MRTLVFVALGTLLVACVQDQNLGHDTGSGGSAGASTTDASTGAMGDAGGASSTASSGVATTGTASGSGGDGGSGEGAAGPVCPGCDFLADATGPTQIALTADRVLWDDGGALRAVAKTGGHPSTLAIKQTSTGFEGLAVQGSTVYSTSPFAAPGPVPGVVTVPIAGGALTTLTSGEPGPGPTYTTDVVVTADRVLWGTYWTDAATNWYGAVQSAPIGGGAPTTIFQGSAVFLLATDGASVFAAAADLNTPVSASIVALPVGGGTALTLAPEYAVSLAVDDTDVYWTGGQIKKVAKTGGAATTLADSIVGPLALEGSSVFVLNVDQPTGVTTLVEIPKTGGAPTTIATLDVGTRTFTEIAADATYVYGLLQGTFVNGVYMHDGGVVRIPR